jgi:hypothetical protein
MPMTAYRGATARWDRTIEMCRLAGKITGWLDEVRAIGRQLGRRRVPSGQTIMTVDGRRIHAAVKPPAWVDHLL